MKNLDCGETKNRLQDAVDRGAMLDAESAGHLAGCSDCRAFQTFLSTCPARLEQALAAHINDAAPDGRRILSLRRERSKKRRIVYSLSGLAAAVILFVGGLSIASLMEREKTARFVSEENSYFVDDLFSQPVFDGIEYITVSQ